MLNELDLPLGVVTSINGSVRYQGEISAPPATPAPRRWTGAAMRCRGAELALYLEHAQPADPDLVATVGMLEVPGARSRGARALLVQPGHQRHEQCGARCLRMISASS